MAYVGYETLCSDSVYISVPDMVYADFGNVRVAGVWRSDKLTSAHAGKTLLFSFSRHHTHAEQVQYLYTLSRSNIVDSKT